MILWSLCRRRRREADVAAATRPVLVVSACRRPVRLGSWQRLLAPLQCGLRCGSDGRSLSCAGLCELGVAMHTETDCIRECLSTLSWLVAQRRVWRAWVALGHGTVRGGCTVRTPHAGAGGPVVRSAVRSRGAKCRVRAALVSHEVQCSVMRDRKMCCSRLRSKVPGTCAPHWQSRTDMRHRARSENRE